MNSLVFLRFSKSTLKTLKCILEISKNIIPGTKFLWLNKFVKYRNNKLFSYDEIAIIFGMTPNNQSFVKYIKLILALPLEWINNDYPANGLYKFIV